MIKPNVGSACTEEGSLSLVCPKCAEEMTMPVFKAATDVKLGPIKLHELHNKFFAVCTKCRCTFEVSEWKS